MAGLKGWELPASFLTSLPTFAHFEFNLKPAKEPWLPSGPRKEARPP